MALTQWLTLACHEVVPGSIAMRSNKMVFYLFAQGYKAVGRNGRVFAIPE